MSFLDDLFGLRGFISEPHDTNHKEYEPSKDIEIKPSVDRERNILGFGSRFKRWCNSTQGLLDVFTQTEL
jgi:hypothetical protein